MQLNKALLFLVISTLCTLATTAQKDSTFSVRNGRIVKDKNTPLNSHRDNELNIRIQRDLAKRFDNPADQFWMITDWGYRVKFVKDSVIYRIDYLKNGNWRNTITSYAAKHASKNLIWRLKGFLSDYMITRINEIEYGLLTTYVINLTGSTSLKTIRITEDAVEIIANYKRSLAGRIPKFAHDPNREPLLSDPSHLYLSDQ